MRSHLTHKRIIQHAIQGHRVGFSNDLLDRSLATLSLNREQVDNHEEDDRSFGACDRVKAATCLIEADECSEKAFNGIRGSGIPV